MADADSQIDSPAEVVMAVVRGKLPLSALVHVGVAFAIEADPGGGRRIQTEKGQPFTIVPALADIASGLRSYRDDPGKLSDWATFVLTADAIVDLTAVSESPEGEKLLNVLWDVSFDWSRSAQLRPTI